MKYLRSCLLVPGAGGRILGHHRRLGTSHCKVKCSRSSEFLYQKRHVSTDGAKNSQLTAVGQVALPPPSIVESSDYVTVRQGVKSRHNPRAEHSSFDRASSAASPHSFSSAMSYGQFLCQAHSLKSTLDPMSMDNVFLPTFHMHDDDIGNVFFPGRSKSSRTNLDTTPIRQDSTENANYARKSTSLEALLPTMKQGDMVLEVPPREVLRTVVQPRNASPLLPTMSQNDLRSFLEVHNFQYRDSDGPVEEKREDILPKSEDSLNCPSNSFIIQSDRSSVIIHRDLYITNRILEKLKKIEEKPVVTSEPPLKAGDQSLTDIGGEELDQVDSPVLVDIAESATGQSSNLAMPCPHSESPHTAKRSTLSNSFNSASEPSSISALVESPTMQKSSGADSYLTNREFEIPKARISKLEYQALQSRKNLYARMKRQSSYCVLVDGLHVKHTTLEDVTSRNATETSALSLVTPFVHACLDSKEPGPLAKIHCRPDTTHYDVPLHEPVPISSEPYLIPQFNFPDISFQNNFDSPFKDVLELSQLETTECDSYPLSFEDCDSSKLQSKLEDWFIPLGNEIDSMLLTIEASRNPSPQESSPQIDGSTPFEEIFSDLPTSEQIRDDAHSIDANNATEGPRMNPQKQSFNSGQYRSVNTTSGSQPPNSKNPHVDIKTETTIKCCRKGDNTDINITETQSYLDKRLPYPFCTETMLQVYGTSESLHKASQAVENSKAQLVHLSNANSPNPGMLTPKLQFNHMLSKSHENAKSNRKKTVLKIKVVPNTDTSSNTPRSSEPKPVPTHILRLTEQSAETSTDVSKLIRRSKFNRKIKKGRKDSALKLRPKKKLNQDSSENIKVLSPKDLELMFPSPPKPKPIEKPRQVTIEIKMGKSPTGFVQSKHQTMQDVLTKPTKVADEEVPPNNERMQPRITNREDLKSMISHEVKDSFMAVSRKTVNPAAANQGTKPDIVQIRQDKGSPQLNNPGSGKARDVALPVKNSDAPTTKPIAQNLKSASNKMKLVNITSDQIYHSGSKMGEQTVVGQPKGETAREKITKSLTSESQDQSQNQELVTEQVERFPKDPTVDVNVEKEQRKELEASQQREKNSSVLPVSANAMIAHVMKTSSEKSTSDSRWHHLDKKTYLGETLKEETVKQTSNAPSNPMPSTEADGSKSYDDRSAKTTEKIVNKQNQRVKAMDDDRKIWSHPTKTVFFPFEAPNEKEMLPSEKSQSSVLSPLKETVTPKSFIEPTLYEADFAKISAENKPSLVQAAPARYTVPVNRMKDFPLMNPGKAKAYFVPSSGAISINPLHDLVLLKTLTRVPAVTKVLGATLSAKSQQALDRWKQGLISTLGEQGFQEFYQNQLKRGTDFHSSVKKVLIDRLDFKDDLCMQSLSSVLKSVSDVGVVESQVVHPLLGYRGVIDCVAKYKGRPVVLEWKRSDKSKPSLKHTYDAPLQLCAYLGAMNFDSNYKTQQVEGGVVVVAYSDGSPADVFELPMEECERYWSKWLRRLRQYYSQSERA